MTAPGEESRTAPTIGVATCQIPWWQKPTRDQWYAYIAAWLGRTLDAFDFTVFLLIMLPIADEVGVSTTSVTIVFTITLWMRLLGATASGWLGDRLGRKLPLMIVILGYSLCNFAAGFSPSFTFLIGARAPRGVFMGSEWPAPESEEATSRSFEDQPLRQGTP
jgi:MFS transporter, SHS family, lactate transporter